MFTFPEDSNHRIGAVRPTPSGSSFYVPTVSFGSDGLTPLFTSTNPAYVVLNSTYVIASNGISSYPVVVEGFQSLAPVDLQTVYREQILFTNTTLIASGTWDSYQANSSGVDCLTFERVSGKVFSDASGEFSLYESDDNTANYWDLVDGPIGVTANTPVTFSWNIASRYLRIIYSNGATAQTVFRFSAYSNVW